VTTPNYTELERVLSEALAQAVEGKGKERNAIVVQDFEDQKICQIARMLGSPQGPIYQACRKAIEAVRLPRNRARDEIRGAIVYLAAAILIVEEQDAAREHPDRDSVAVDYGVRGDGQGDLRGGVTDGQ